MNIYLVRHTAVDVPAGLCYGQTDVPLADSYGSELTQVARQLPNKTKDMRFFSSPSSRCTRLAKSLSAGNFQTDQRLMEFNFGDWENRLWQDIDNPRTRSWGDNFLTAACPNGESYATLRERVLDFWREHVVGVNQPIVIVSHGGPIRIMLAEARNTPSAKIFTQSVEYGQVFQLQV